MESSDGCRLNLECSAHHSIWLRTVWGSCLINPQHAALAPELLPASMLPWIRHTVDIEGIHYAQQAEVTNGVDHSTVYELDVFLALLC